MGPCAWQGGAGSQLPGRDGRKRSLGSLLGTADGKPLALVFCGPECGPCADFMPELIAFDDEHAASVTLALITARRRDQRRHRRRRASPPSRSPPGGSRGDGGLRRPGDAQRRPGRRRDDRQPARPRRGRHSQPPGVCRPRPAVEGTRAFGAQQVTHWPVTEPHSTLSLQQKQFDGQPFAQTGPQGLKPQPGAARQMCCSRSQKPEQHCLLLPQCRPRSLQWPGLWCAPRSSTACRRDVVPAKPRASSSNCSSLTAPILRRRATRVHPPTAHAAKPAAS
jgi:thiol-disulfide isomerase/thioredoxin